MFKVPSQSLSSSSVAGPWRNHIALLWTISTRPKASSVRANISMTWADSPTSVRTKMASPPSALILSTTRWPPSALTSATQTDAPSRARTCAVTSPIPEAAPVTMAALPATRPLFIVDLLCQKLDMLSVNHVCSELSSSLGMSIRALMALFLKILCDFFIDFAHGLFRKSTFHPTHDCFGQTNKSLCLPLRRFYRSNLYYPCAFPNLAGLLLRYQRVRPNP